MSIGDLATSASSRARTTEAGAGGRSPLPGNGKQRRIITGPIGTKVWVRFARLRYGLQSEWSVPVLVTLS
jgi:hypothetical protein